MTIIAGFKSYEGVVICADTQETTEHSKRKVTKVRFEQVGGPNAESHSLSAAFCGAGHGPFIDKLIEEAWQAAQTVSSLDDACTEIDRSIKEQYREFGRIYQNGYCPDADLIFGVNMLGQSRLFSAHGPIVNEKQGYECGGVGHYIGDFLAGRMFTDYLGVKECVSLAAYILLQAKEHVEGCGGESHIAVLRNEQSSGMIDWKRVETITELLGWADREFGRLLLTSADLEISEGEFANQVKSAKNALSTWRNNKRTDLKSHEEMNELFVGETRPVDSWGLPILQPNESAEPIFSDDNIEPNESKTH